MIHHTLEGGSSTSSSLQQSFLDFLWFQCSHLEEANFCSLGTLFSVWCRHNMLWLLHCAQQLPWHLNTVVA